MSKARELREIAVYAALGVASVAAIIALDKSSSTAPPDPAYTACMDKTPSLPGPLDLLKHVNCALQAPATPRSNGLKTPQGPQ
jgi:hypothetical protein